MSWSTGKPKKEGTYIVVIRVNKEMFYYKLTKWYKGFGFVCEKEGCKVEAWQMVEPYEGDK